MQQIRQAHIVPANGGERLTLGASTITIKLAGEQTGQSLALIDYEVGAGFPGPPLHIHPAFDEVFVVLSGRLEFRIGDEAVTGTAGAVVYTPGDQPHTFSNPSDEGARMLVGVTPSGFEQFFRDLAAAAGDGAPDPETVARLNAEHGVEFVQ